MQRETPTISSAKHPLFSKTSTASLKEAPNPEPKLKLNSRKKIKLESQTQSRTPKSGFQKYISSVYKTPLSSQSVFLINKFTLSTR